MRRVKLLSVLMLVVLMLSGCSAVEQKEGVFYSFIVQPMEIFLHFLGNSVFAGSYGLAIISITVIIRLILMPIMLKNYRQQQGMKSKMDLLKPEMEELQKKIKAAETKEQQSEYQREMMGLYQKHGVNPLNMGCLPLIIQTPIVMALYFSILYSTDVKTHEFMWYSLGSPDIWMTLIAGAVYFVQAKVSLWTVPEQQKAQMKMFIYISPIMIMFISFTSMAALPLYWSVSGILLILQTYIGRKYYSEHPEKAVE